MSSQSYTAKRGHKQSNTGRILASAAVLIVLAAMAFDTRIIRIGSSDDVKAGVFSAADYGATEFPKVKAGVEERAVDAVTAAVADGALKVGADAGLPLTRFPLEQTADAHRAVEANVVGKVLIEVSQEAAR